MGKRKLKFINLFNPLVHNINIQYKGRLTKILILERILKKFLLSVASMSR